METGTKTAEAALAEAEEEARAKDVRAATSRAEAARLEAEESARQHSAAELAISHFNATRQLLVRPQLASC